MEVWALEAYAASNILQEMITIKSDDVYGRAKAYESIIKDEPIVGPKLPESFNVLVKELQGLGLRVDLLDETSQETLDAEQLIKEDDEIVATDGLDEIRIDEEIEEPEDIEDMEGFGEIEETPELEEEA